MLSNLSRTLTYILAILYAILGVALIFSITAAALINLDKFDFVIRPGGILYIGAYLAALATALVILAVHRADWPAFKEPA